MENYYTHNCRVMVLSVTILSNEQPKKFSLLLQIFAAIADIKIHIKGHFWFVDSTYNFIVSWNSNNSTIFILVLVFSGDLRTLIIWIFPVQLEVRSCWLLRCFCSEPLPGNQHPSDFSDHKSCEKRDIIISIWHVTNVRSCDFKGWNLP